MKDLIQEIFFTPLSQMNGFNFILLILLSAIAVTVVIYTYIAIFKFFKILFLGTKNIISAKSKCQHIQCSTCGRTLDRCVCQKNRDRSAASRLYNYNKEERAARKKKHK